MSRFSELYPALARRMFHHPPGPFRSITDVEGVEVGQVTVRDEAAGLHTGVTAIWPRRDVMVARPFAGVHALHGAGEMTGFLQIAEWGVIETPILLGSSLAVGRIHDGLIEALKALDPEMGVSRDVLLPVVAECDDGVLSDARARAIGSGHVARALSGARGGPLEEGSVGAGTGMIAFDFKAGIGTASRRLEVAGAGPATVGVLVNANFGFCRQLRFGGIPVGAEFAGRVAEQSNGELRTPSQERSVIVVVATDLPLRPDQLRRLSVRATMGLSRVGSFAGHGSGEIALAFSTTAGLARDRSQSRPAEVAERSLNAVYEATVEAVEESVLNALCAGRDTTGRGGRFVPGLLGDPLRRTRLETIERFFAGPS